MSLDSPVYLVTGAGGALGQVTIKLLIAEGALLAGADRSNAPTGFGDVLWLSGANFFEAGSCDGLIQVVLDRFGRLDGVVHTVGGFSVAKAEESTPALWEEMFRLNTLTTLNVFRSALPAMRKAGRGSLVAIAAGAGVKSPSGFGAYAASKAGVLRLVEAFAEETKADGVRINAILPGTMDTPRNRADMPNADPARWVQPREVAKAIAFLLGDASSGLTGAAIPMTGRS